MTNNAKRVAKSRKKSGSKQVNIVLKADELALLEKLKGPNGQTKGTIMAALRHMAGANDLSQAEVLDWIKRNT